MALKSCPHNTTACRDDVLFITRKIDEVLISTFEKRISGLNKVHKLPVTKSIVGISIEFTLFFNGPLKK